MPSFFLSQDTYFGIIIHKNGLTWEFNLLEAVQYVIQKAAIRPLVSKNIACAVSVGRSGGYCCKRNIDLYSLNTEKNKTAYRPLWRDALMGFFLWGYMSPIK